MSNKRGRLRQRAVVVNVLRAADLETPHARSAEVSQPDLQIEDGRVTAYRAKVKVSFKFEGD
jgi:hypothetical protein